MATPTDLSQWLGQQLWPVAILAGIAFLVYAAIRLSASRRRRSLIRQREGVTEEAFVAYLAQFGFDLTIAASTYRYLQQIQRVDFPILPSDSLDEDLGLGHEEVEQTLRDLASALGRDLHAGLAYAPIVSVEDLIRRLQASPRSARHVAA